MKTLIKWPGGKAREYTKIKDIIPPDIRTYIEPFFGGGAVYFKLEPKNAVINDINVNLMAFYRLFKEDNQSFRKSLNLIADDWENLTAISAYVYENIYKYKNNFNVEKISTAVQKLIRQNSLPELNYGNGQFWILLNKGLLDKFRRIVGL
jgi:DNA adenine methylase